MAAGTVSLGNQTVLYNNHAATAGDDIYNTGTITFGKVGSDWTLDDCDDAIDGWYQDGAEKRWSAHEEPLNAVEFKQFERNGMATVTGMLSLKAAHGLTPVEPAIPICRLADF